LSALGDLRHGACHQRGVWQLEVTAFVVLGHLEQVSLFRLWRWTEGRYGSDGPEETPRATSHLDLSR
jgi:hypothetical protein